MLNLGLVNSQAGNGTFTLTRVDVDVTTAGGAIGTDIGSVYVATGSDCSGSLGSATPSSATQTSGSAGVGQSGALSPQTLSALFAAQDPSQTSSTSLSDALKDLFSQLDGNGDGQISKSEFESALRAGGTNTANADSVFSKLDTNGDGSVSLDELSSALKGKGGGHGHHHAHGAGGGGGKGTRQRRGQAV